MPKPINNNEWSYESNDRIDIGNIECHNINNESIQNFETINQARLAKGCYFYSRGTNGNNPREDQKILIKKKKKTTIKVAKIITTKGDTIVKKEIIIILLITLNV